MMLINHKYFGTRQMLQHLIIIHKPFKSMLCYSWFTSGSRSVLSLIAIYIITLLFVFKVVNKRILHLQWHFILLGFLLGQKVPKRRLTVSTPIPYRLQYQVQMCRAVQYHFIVISVHAFSFIYRLSRLILICFGSLPPSSFSDTKVDASFSASMSTDDSGLGTKKPRLSQYCKSTYYTNLRI